MTITENDIIKNYERDSLFDELGIKRLKSGYMFGDQKSPQDRFAYSCAKFGSNIEHAQRLYEYASKMWLSLSTPLLSYGKTKNSLPISCFLNDTGDSLESIMYNLTESNILSTVGGGVSQYLGMRHADEKSTGPIIHARTYDANMMAWQQGETRRGSYAVYLDINNPEIKEFIDIRRPTGGDPNRKSLNLNHGINITDDFMELIEKCMNDPKQDDSWNLLDKQGNIIETVSAKELWIALITARVETGEPYIHFIDTANKALPQHLKDKGLRIKSSNLCVEIELPINEDRTAVCCLSSVNLEYFDEWKEDNLFIRDVIEMLDNVLQVFIDEAPETLKRAIHSASQERSVGLGVLGFHSYLQQNEIPFDSALAKGKNIEFFKHIRENADRANLELGKERGEAPDAIGTGKRLSHLMSVAPTASASIIVGNTSPSIEPFSANGYTQKTLSGSHENRNKNLVKLLNKKKQEDVSLDLKKIWESIISNSGSVQHLDCLTPYEKACYKTFPEIDQMYIINMASDRQVYIDQGQSINIKPYADISKRDLHNLHFQAWKKGLKALYYCRVEPNTRAESVNNKVKKEIIQEESTCVACEG